MDVRQVRQTVTHDAQQLEHAVTHTATEAVHTVKQDAQKVEHAVTKEAGKVTQDVKQVATRVGQAVENGAKQVVHDVKTEAHAVQQKAAQAYAKAQQAVTHEVSTVKHDVQQLGHEVAQGAENMAKHPLATVGAVSELVGGGLEAVGGAVLGVATAETGVGAVVGGLAAVDGTSHAVAGARDLASIFNGNMKAVGTHNVLANMAQHYGGTTGERVYDVASIGLSFVGGEASDVSKLIDVAKQGTESAGKVVQGAVDGLRGMGARGPELSLAGADGGSLRGSIQMEKTVQNDTVLFAKGADRVRNANLAGSTHPVTGVKFDSNGFPVFNSKFDTTLEKDLYTASDRAQFREATRQLHSAIQYHLQTSSANPN